MAIFTRTHEDGTTLRTAPWAGHDGNGNGNGHGHGNGHGRGPISRARSVVQRPWWWALLAVVIAGATLAGVEVAAGPATYPVTARFAQAPGLFPGASVQVLGVPVGTVTSVRNVGDEVIVKLAIDRSERVPRTVTAALVSPEILGEPDIDLSPGYTGGATLQAGAIIPMSRTAVPVSTEQVLKSLRTTLERINPHAVGDLVTNLAQDLHGQGKNLNKLISGAAGTLQVLATKADTLGQMNGSLAQLTGVLDARTSQITQLITDYDTVSGVVAQHSSQLGGALVQFSQASSELVQLLEPNLAPLESDVGTITTVGRTLDRNLTSIDEILSSEVALFTGARRVYTSTYNWLTLNAQSPTGLTGAILTSMVRSRLEGVCRRMLAHHATGLSSAQRKTLETCGKTSSTFFTKSLSQLPAILNDVRAGKLPAPGSAASMFSKGLKKIPGVKSSKSTKSSARSKASGTSAPTTTTTPGGSGTTGTPGTGGKGGTTGSGSGTSTKTCTDLLGILKCGAKGSSTKSGTGTGSGLLSYDVPAGSSAQGLHTSALAELPPLPQGAPGAAVHRARGHARLMAHRHHRGRRRHRRRRHRSPGARG